MSAPLGAAKVFALVFGGFTVVMIGVVLGSWLARLTGRARFHRKGVRP